MESSLPIQRSHPASEPDARWYRFALLLTGDAAAAEEILRGTFAVAPHELAQLRSKERRTNWMIRQIRSRALKRQQINRADPDVSLWLPRRVAGLPEPGRSAFALFHCLDNSLEDMAEMLGMRRAAFSQALASARQELSPDGAFPKNALLRMHRAWGGDGPKIARAARAAQADPKLGAQVAVDLQWHEEIARLEVPEEIALLHLAEPPKMGLGTLLFQPAVLAIVLALVVVVAVLVHIAQTRMDDFPGKDAVVALVDAESSRSGPEFEEISPLEAGKVDDWFALKGFEGYAAPRELQKARVIGCRVLKQEGVPMAEVVFEKQNARMLVFRAAELKDGIEKAGRHIFQHEEWAVAAWNEQGNSYVVMLNGDWKEMPGFLHN